jgi:sigma-B regulation protein RsbU (phosphoserine phosphatase)
LVHRRASNRIETVSNEGSWIGILRELEGHLSDLELPMAKGDTLLLFTDGVTEAENLSGEQYGQTRLEAAFAKVVDLPPARALAVLLEEVQAFQAEQQDDITLMLLRRS